MRLNGAAFYTDYQRIQILALQGGFFSNRNAGDARLTGAELELTAKPTELLSLNLGAGFTDAKYTRLEPGTGLTTASRLPYAPRWTYTAGAQLDAHAGALGAFVARVDYAYKSQQNVFSPIGLEPGYGLLNARVSLTPRAGLTLAVYGRNITDRRYAVYRSVDLSGAPGSLGISNEFLGLPREIGGEIVVAF